jgi:hypothetical protein
VFFCCKCYPNRSTTTPNKLAPRSTLCVFLGYPSEPKGYRCLDLARNCLIISRHVTFGESSFPFPELPAPLPLSNLEFLSEFDYVSSPISSPVVAGTGLAGPGAAGLGRSAAAPDESISRLLPLGHWTHRLSSSPPCTDHGGGHFHSIC